MHIDLRPATTTAWIGRLPEDFREVMSHETRLTDEVAEEIKAIITALPAGSSILDQFKAVEPKMDTLSRAERMNLICTLVRDVPYLEYCRLSIYLNDEDESGNGNASLVLEDISSIAGALGNRIHTNFDVTEAMRIVQDSISSVYGVEDAPQNYM